jgi:serine/threonine-protein kinase
MHREIASHFDQLERFRREARAVAQLSHPHVVGVIDAGEDDGRPYIVFEFVEGETLKDRIRRLGRLPVDEAIAYAIEVARALGAAHARNIVHRDVKPQNVLIDEEGTARVTDFGIARSLHEEALTAPGRVLGTTDYVSPEQALGHEVSGQSDIYSLGIVLFEMLTGDVPFHGASQVSVAMKHVREDIPDVQGRRPEVSATLASVLDRMTDRDLGQRYPDAATLVADLEEALAIEAARAGRSTGEATAVLRTLPEDARRRLPLRMRRRVPILAIVGVLAIAAVVLILLAREGVERTQRGTGAGKVEEPPTGLQVVSVKRDAARDYDPLGGDGEHAELAPLAIDREPGTSWRTESYSDEVLTKDGVGLYIDAEPGLVARAVQIDTPRAGWKVELHAARRGPPEGIEGWERVGGGTVHRREQRFTLRTAGEEYRYFLAWITELPPGERQVEITEFRLFERQRT